MILIVIGALGAKHLSTAFLVLIKLKKQNEQPPASSAVWIGARLEKSCVHSSLVVLGWKHIIILNTIATMIRTVTTLFKS